MNEKTRTISNDEIKTELLELVEAYKNLFANVTYGKVGYSLYSDYTEYTNYQFKLIEDITLLNDRHSYQASLALLRTVFEHYLLFMLMTLGKVHFRLFTIPKGKTKQDTIKQWNKDIASKRLKNETHAIKAAPYSFDPSVISVTYEGPYVDGKKGKGRLVPFYISVYQQFDADAANLEFNYLDMSPLYEKRTELFKKRKTENKYLYRHYLSYGAILYSLRINNFSSLSIQPRIEAHYNFLSKFVHPNNAAKMHLRATNRVISRPEDLELLSQENKTLQLLINLYAVSIAIGYLRTLIRVIEEAPKLHFKQADFTALKARLDELEGKYDFFWFIYNSPHDYDRFYSSVRKKAYRGKQFDFKNLPNKDVMFDKAILSRLQNIQLGVSNKLVGAYAPDFRLT